ncbi:efflux RND transporter periplasmic adaptor subunit [Clostridium sp. OF09-36]|uniref:efflux RND transporter periplasmic adaptor subunit n=1 Tax=Clostridium sp. OF09-36 TaxID=2292310 RepID=UPI001FAACA9D|nr:efflux RND transporter periplasmic adaptor subunit [Clostridium sp. OF09-36]
MKKKVVIAGVVVAAIAVVAGLSLTRGKQTEEETLIPVVNVESPKTGSIELYRSLVGKVEPSDVVYIYPKAAGEITDVFVKAGDMVQEGQPICKIDTKQVEAARLQMESAQQALGDANTNLARQQALFAAGDIASVAFEQAQTQAKNAQIAYDSAKLNYDYQVEFANVTAPISGKVEICNVEVHDNVASQVLLAVISGEGSKSITFSVPEKIASELHVGDPVTVDKNGTDYQGTINEVSSMIDDSTGLFKIKASVDNGDALPTGSTTKLSVISDRADNVLTIPVDAVTTPAVTLTFIPMTTEPCIMFRLKLAFTILRRHRFFLVSMLPMRSLPPGALSCMRALRCRRQTQMQQLPRILRAMHRAKQQTMQRPPKMQKALSSCRDKR